MKTRGRPNRGSVRETAPNVWRVRVTVGDKADGTRRTLSATVKGDRRAAERKRAELLIEADRLRDRPGKADADTYGAWLDVWLYARRKKITEHTRETYRRVIDRHIRPALGHLRPRALTGTLLTGFYADLADSGLSGSMINQVHAIVHGSLKQAQRDGLVADNAAGFADRPKSRPRPAPVPTHEEIAAVLAANADRWEAMAVLVMLGAGLRRGECIGLCWRDIDLDAGLLRVERTVEVFKREFHIGPPKSAASLRSVSLPGALVAHLRAYQRTQKKAQLRTGARPPDDLLFPTRRGGVMHPSSFGLAIKKAGQRAGVHLTPHMLRHRAATDLLEAGLSPKVAQHRLGHADVSVTLDVYQHVLKKSADQGAEAAGKVIEFVSVSQIPVTK